QVYDRMRAERRQVASRLRAEGEEQARIIRAEADRERTVLLAEAERDAQRLRGEGDAEATRIYGEAAQRDPAFYAFQRSLEAYRNACENGDGVIVLERNDPFLQYMRSDRRGGRCAGRARPGAECAASGRRPRPPCPTSANQDLPTRERPLGRPLPRRRP